MRVLLVLLVCLIPHLVIAQTDPYKTLGVQRGESYEQIKARHRRLVFELHPDRHPGEVKQATEKVALINAAFDQIKKEFKDGSVHKESSSERPQKEAAAATSESASKKNDQTPKWNYFDSESLDAYWDNWGLRVNWDQLTQAFRSGAEAQAKADRLAKQTLDHLFPGLKTQNMGLGWTREGIEYQTSRLFYYYNFNMGIGGPQEADPLSAFVAAVSSGRETTEPFFYNHLRRDVSLQSVVYEIGMDPAARVTNRIPPLYQEGMAAMTAFISSNLNRFRYVPKEAMAMQPPSGRSSAGWGKFTGRKAAEMILPFLHHAEDRSELILRILENSGSAAEFDEMSKLYFDEVDRQQILHSTVENRTRPAQARANVARAKEARADLKISSLGPSCATALKHRQSP